jgi:hypothetical protein
MCARPGEHYLVAFNYTHRDQTWKLWAQLTDKTWLPVATFGEVTEDSLPGVPVCGR